LQQDLRSPKFEVLLVDAMVAGEVYTYGEELKECPSRWVKRFTLNSFVPTTEEYNAYAEAKGNLDKLTWSWLKIGLKRWLVRAVFIYILPIGFACLAVAMRWEGVAFALVAFVAVTLAYSLVSWLWQKLRSLFHMPKRDPFERAVALHVKMVRAYEELKGGAASSPQRVREVLAKVADEGAAWDPRVFSILDAAIARSRGNWG
jgi:hypothetical protein